MTKRFEDLHASALSAADAALTHIAETEQLTEEQYSRITARALEKAGITAEKQPAQPVIRHRKRTKLIGALIAAALSLTVLAGGVGGYMRYNKQLMEKRFGVLGAARLEDLEVPDPGTFTNGTVNATLEGVLCDGKSAMVLITYATVDPEQKIDWDYQLYRAAVRADAEGRPQAYEAMKNDQAFGNECLETIMLNIPDAPHSDTYTMYYEKEETNFPSKEEVKEFKKSGGQVEDIYEAPEFIGSEVPYFKDLTDGLEIEIPLIQNVPTVQLRGENGKTVTLSGFELFSKENILEGTGARDSDFSLKIYRNDGSVSETCALHGGGSFSSENDLFDYSALYFVEKIDGVKYKANKPDTYIGFTDVTDVSAVELMGVMYTRTEPKQPPLADENGSPVPHSDTEYAVNESGQTYGAGLRVMYTEDLPDLVAVIGDNGKEGYIRKSDFIGYEPQTPAEAVRITERQDAGLLPPEVYPVYLSDGVTEIDTFTVGDRHLSGNAGNAD